MVAGSAAQIVVAEGTVLDPAEGVGSFVDKANGFAGDTGPEVDIVPGEGTGLEEGTGPEEDIDLEEDRALEGPVDNLELEKLDIAYQLPAQTSWAMQDSQCWPCGG